MCNLINTDTHTHTHTHTRNLINTHIHTQNKKIGPVAANLDNLESNKETEGGAQGTQDLSKNCTSRESVSPLSRLIRGFRNKYH